jgi:hypothetical protein
VEPDDKAILIDRAPEKLLLSSPLAPDEVPEETEET